MPEVPQNPENNGTKPPQLEKCLKNLRSQVGRLLTYAISDTNKDLAKEKPPLKWYLLRPFIGALSALVIFIFAKACQITLTADINESGTLSPFLLSLFGSPGLLSDRAYAQMSYVSGKMLGDVGAEQERWSSYDAHYSSTSSYRRHIL